MQALDRSIWGGRLVKLTIVSLALLVAACGTSEAETEDSDKEVAGETYDEYDTRRDSLDGSRGTFRGQGCTVNCSGHEAGYAWAEEKGITDPDDCGGNSWSFIEGCQAYAEENAEAEE